MALSQPAPTAEVAAVAAEMAPELGMRRVRWVVITVTDEGVRAEVAGLAHRFPIMRPVTVQVANRLIRAGVPAFVRRPGGGELPAESRAHAG